MSTISTDALVTERLVLRRPRDGDLEPFALLCADADVLCTVRAHAPEVATAQTSLLLGWCGLGDNAQIPDPYTLNTAAFERAWELVDAAAEAIVERLK